MEEQTCHHLDSMSWISAPKQTASPTIRKPSKAQSIFARNAAVDAFSSHSAPTVTASHHRPWKHTMAALFVHSLSSRQVPITSFLKVKCPAVCSTPILSAVRTVPTSSVPRSSGRYATTTRSFSLTGRLPKSMTRGNAPTPFSPLPKAIHAKDISA